MLRFGRVYTAAAYDTFIVIISYHIFFLARILNKSLPVVLPVLLKPETDEVRHWTAVGRGREPKGFGKFNFLQSALECRVSSFAGVNFQLLTGLFIAFHSRKRHDSHPRRLPSFLPSSGSAKFWR